MISLPCLIHSLFSFTSQAQAVQALTLKVLDIAPGTSLTYFLREWAGEYTLVESQDRTTATVTFTKERIMKTCLGVLGGGIRGVFRIERPLPPPEHLRLAIVQL